MKSSDDRIPFTCAITGEDCGEMISHIYLSLNQGDSLLDTKYVGIIPVSPKVISMIDRRKYNKLTTILKKEIKNFVKEK